MQPLGSDIFGYDSDNLVTETLVSVITKTVITLDDGGKQLVAVKAGKAKKRLVLEPHDIIKELRLLSSLSHPAIISVLGQDYDASQSLQRFWMPFIPFTLADLLSIPTFSPIPNPDETHDSQSTLAFTVVAKSIIYQVLSGVAYLHAPERQIAHRDIKPRNILLDTSGTAVLIDFGVAYSPIAGPRDVWPEPEGKMYFEVGSGPYRAPELLFGVRRYNATACDLWALGTTFAEFFTTIHRRAMTDDFDDDSEADERGDPTKAYLLDELPEAWARSEWERYPLFDGSRGDIGLAWSIFRTRSSPTPENWPTFTELPDANKINFIDSPGVYLSTLLPHLNAPLPLGRPAHFLPAQQEPTVVDLLQRLLIYPPDSRLKAAEALGHPWLLSDGPLVLPRAAALTGGNPSQDTAAEIRDGKTAGEWLKLFLAPGLQE
ncbi:kinase-like protein [Lactifluus subvellereus]|nr:kinase-like protein [Lactifluus subvellereus]